MSCSEFFGHFAAALINALCSALMRATSALEASAEKGALTKTIGGEVFAASSILRVRSLIPATSSIAMSTIPATV